LKSLRRIPEKVSDAGYKMGETFVCISSGKSFQEPFLMAVMSIFNILFAGEWV
jgi:hypothetical protein